MAASAAVVFCVLASCLQQFGIGQTTVGKAGFITTLYIIIVPFMGLFLKRKIGINIWISAVIAAVGMYFLCMTESFLHRGGRPAGVDVFRGIFGTYSGD